MHRIVSAALLLASPALASCVSVSAPPSAPEPSSAPRPTPGAARPQIAEPSAHEGLETIRPGRAHSSPTHRSRPAADRASAHPAVPRSAAPRGRTVPRSGTSAWPEPRPSRVPVPAPGPARTAGMCDLGETYGNWAPGSTQARICRDVYGP
ncbi:hypothetical protein [Streptomyces sp. NPDC047108]|uniref:hypothetical protein n=1 Tax=Streptomyces sp. NPDC047108 TaxID=3155025 RepID=UPI0033E5B233